MKIFKTAAFILALAVQSLSAIGGTSTLKVNSEELIPIGQEAEQAVEEEFLILRKKRVQKLNLSTLKPIAEEEEAAVEDVHFTVTQKAAMNASQDKLQLSELIPVEEEPEASAEDLPFTRH